MKVSIVLPVKIQEPQDYQLLRFSVWCMKNLTNVPNELIIVESNGNYGNTLPEVDHHIDVKQPKGYSAEWNEGADVASGDYIVHIGMDIIVQSRWLEALLECYDYHDCGVASLACTEPGAAVGPLEPMRSINEGWYGPLMMLPPDCRLDAKAFPGLGSDSDLILRQYAKGLRAYRNNSVVCHHLDGIQYKRKPRSDRDRETMEVRSKMIARWGQSPIWAVRMVLDGTVVFGREYGQY